MAPHDGLAEIIAERLNLPWAKLNYAMFYGMDEQEVGDSVITTSSAGASGWANAKLDLMCDSAVEDPIGTSQRLSAVAAYHHELEERGRTVQYQQRLAGAGHDLTGRRGGALRAAADDQ